MRIYFSIILIFILGCSENGWTNEEKALLEEQCIENAKIEILNKDKNQLANICSCVVKKFIENFSWSEYQKMLELKITAQNSPELSSRLQIHISSVMKECSISL